MTTEPEKYKPLGQGFADALGNRNKAAAPEPEPTPSGPIAPSEGAPRYTVTANPMTEFLDSIFGN